MVQPNTKDERLFVNMESLKQSQFVSNPKNRSEFVRLAEYGGFEKWFRDYYGYSYSELVRCVGTFGNQFRNEKQSEEQEQWNG